MNEEVPRRLVRPTDALTEQIIGAAFEVANILGHGFLENVYRRSMASELSRRGLQALQEIHFPVFYKGDPVGDYVADLVVEGRVIVELKAVGALDQAHVGQVMNYLKASGLEAALLFNFGRPKVEYKRVLL